MYRILANMVRDLNALVAIGFVLIGAAVGLGLGASTNNPGASDVILLAILGGAVGFIFAIFVCGLTAVFVQIEHHLEAMEKMMESARKSKEV